MKKPKYLYHGSGKRLELLKPRKPDDSDPTHSKKGVYATSLKKVALGMAAMRSAKVSAFKNRKTHQINIVKGSPDLKAIVYLYILDSNDFEQNCKDEYIATKKVKPVRVEEYKVSELRHLWRKSNIKELKEFLKDREEWRSPKNYPEKELRKLWKKYVDKSYAYRTQTKEHLKEILKDGFDPNYCPYVEIRPKLERFYDLVLKLEKKGYKMTLDWKGVYPSGSEAVRVSREDLDNPFVDFAIDLEQTKTFIKRFRGGAIAGNVLEMVNEINGFDVKLTKSQEENIKEFVLWAKKKMSYSNFLMRVKLSCKCFEKAKFHVFVEKGYWKSPYGSFENFKKVIEKYGFEKYEPYLKKKRRAYIRVIDGVAANDIEVMR